MGSLQSFVEKMGSNFLVAAFIPSLAFVALGMFAFEPILPSEIKERLIKAFNPLAQPGLVTLVVAIILGFTLTSLNTFLIKSFEGYLLVWRFSFIGQGELNTYKKMKRQIDQTKRRIKILMDQSGNSFQIKRDSLIDKLALLETEFQRRFPTKVEDVLPFQFGNILKAAEVYPMTHYKIDSVTLWPRLIHVIPPSYSSKIDQTHNQLSFLVNCAVLSWLFAGLSVIAAISQFTIAYLIKNQINSGGYFIQIDLQADWNNFFRMALLYIGVFIGTNFLAIIFYRASLFSVSEFGEMICSAYDLFRLDLIKQLHLSLPDQPAQEMNIWAAVTDFNNYGYAIADFRLSPMKMLWFVHNYQNDSKQNPQEGKGDSDKDKQEQSDSPK